MIHCPHCGAVNPDDANLCSACGQSLPAPTAGGMKCPMCGAENDPSAVVCSECGARLSPITPAAAEAEPVQGAPIGGLPVPEEPRGEMGPSSLPDEPGKIPEKVPLWLQNLLIVHGLVVPAEEEQVEPVSLPDRIAEPEPAEEPALLAEAEVEDWLTAMRESVEQPPAVEAEEAEEEGVADWLQVLRSEGEAWEQDTEETEATAVPLDEDTSDWLRSLREPEAEVTGEPSSAMDVEDEGPDWLRDLGEVVTEAEELSPPVEETAVSAQPLAEEELPDWLRELGEAELEEEEPQEKELSALVEEPPVAETFVDEEELPAWLRDLDQVAIETEREEPSVVEPPEAPAIGEEELPEWLVELRGETFKEEAVVSPVEAVPSAEEVPALEDKVDGVELPEWLQDAAVPQEEPEPSEPAAPVTRDALIEKAGLDEDEETEIEIPGWLQEVRDVESVLTDEEPVEEPAPPDWLAQPEVPGVTVEEGDVPAPDWLQGPAPADREVAGEEQDRVPPDWLEGLQPSAEAPVGEEAPPFVGEGLEEVAAVVEAPSPEELPVSEEPVAGVVEGAEDLVRAEIPDWMLALRPRKPGEEPTEEQGIVELGGPLAGIKGVLPVEPIITLPHLARPETVVVAVPPVAGDLFAEMVAQPSVSTAAVPRRVKTPFVAGVQRALIYLLLLAAVVVPILMVPIYGPADAKVLHAGGEAFYALLDGRGPIALPAESVVVVAFDYNPATAAELSLQARAIVDHLMGRSMRIMAISLYPEGAALAWDVLDELAAERGYVYGEDYIHLGYLPNQPASVRYFLDAGPTGKGRTDYRSGREVSRYPVAEGVDDLSAVGLVVELAGDERTLRTWVEQITVRPEVPVVAGVSAATAPYAWPYLDSGQLQALLVGMPGAAEYEAQAGRQGKAIDSLGSQVAAQSVIVLLILLGNLVHLVTRGGKR